ncbi:glycoside hydrolase domain-containing protein [Nocardia wallacei]|uniref:glycoside hydrolase domain-containing protein n=1 Tax=Nocardia wallacei TaxID=480035 RepID=UPI002455A3AC|nr:glycoside hydrolase domain-containing protein [Nocardia wallacei]
MTQLIDFSAALIEPVAIRAAGFAGVIGYFSDRRAEWMLAKPLTRDYCDQLRAEGLEIVTNFQYAQGGNATSDWRGGFAAGVRNAERALELHFAAGGPGYRPLYCSIDSAPTLHMWNTLVVEYVRGWASVVGLEWTGIYANADTIDNAIQDGVATWFWQHNNLGYPAAHPHHPAAHIHQIRIDSDMVAGIGVDINVTLKDDYGQWSKSAAPVDPSRPGTGVVVVNPPLAEEDQTDNSPNSSSRHGARIRLGVIHTQEGNGDAGSLTGYLKNPAAQVSYHYSVDNTRCIAVVDTDRSSWSVLDANPYSVNLCFAGSRVSMSRDEWMSKYGKAIDMAAYLMVRDGKKYGFDPRVIGWDELRIGEDGLTDHYGITRGLGIGTHTDCGPNFPWDYYNERVTAWRDSQGAGPLPIVNEIDAKAAESPWLGTRITDGENTCPDGVGKFAQFERGYIYWHYATGAHPIPQALWPKFEAMGWEAGELGYPITDHTVLKGPQGTDWGEVQGFQGGALYRQYGADAVWMHGAIRDRWNRSGFENGPFGWPLADEEPVDGGARQRFEHGSIYWPGKRATLALLDADGPDTPVPDAQD